MEFHTAFKTFLSGAQKIINVYYSRNFPSLDIPQLEFTAGKRYIRVTTNGSAFCFVDKESGDVLKPNGWKTPAKHARGNIHDDDNGLGLMTAYGPKSLR